MWKNVVDPGRPQIQYGTCAVYGMCKATVTHLEYVILLFHCDSGYTDTPNIVKCALPVLFSMMLMGSNYKNCHKSGGKGCVYIKD